jgi:hypothetical protein
MKKKNRSTCVVIGGVLGAGCLGLMAVSLVCSIASSSLRSVGLLPTLTPRPTQTPAELRRQLQRKAENSLPAYRFITCCRLEQF